MRILGVFGRFLSIVGLVALPVFSAQAGLFDFFSPFEPEPQRAIEQPATSELPPPVIPLQQHRVETHRHMMVVRKNPNDKTPADHRSLGLKKDSTLREGDAVMTANGRRIYASASSSQMSEVAKLDGANGAKGLSQTEQTALAAVDVQKTETKSASADELLTGRSSATESSVAWKWLRDPKGKLVRYVGP